MRILVVEDDVLVARTLKMLLAASNYAVDTSFNAEGALEMIEAFEYDLIVLDILLPGTNGIDLCQRLRLQSYQMPILLLTGQDKNQQKAIALNHGADDYVVKPFDPQELIARIQALLRRGTVPIQPVLVWGALRLDPSSHVVTYATHPLSLTPKEFAILELFLRNTQRVLSSKALLEHAWTALENPGEETVRVHIKELRKKLSAAGAPSDFIETRYRVGYRLKPLESVSLPMQVASGLTQRDAADTKYATNDQKTDTSVAKLAQNVVALATAKSRLAAQIRALLEPQNFQVITLTDIEQFWQELLSCQPSLLILDSDLSRGNSFKLCQEIRQTFPWQNLPIVFLTPNKNVTLVHQVFAAGANDFVSQPIIGPELISRVSVRLAH